MIACTSCLWKTGFSTPFSRISFPRKNVLEKSSDSVGTIASSLLDRSPIDRFGKKARKRDKGKKKAIEGERERQRKEEGERKRETKERRRRVSTRSWTSRLRVDTIRRGEGDNKISESAGRCRNSGYVTGTTPLHSTAEGRVPSRRGV